MRHSIARVASVLAVAIVAALSTTAALAGNGNGNSASAPGQMKQQGQPAQPEAAQPVAQSDTAPGIKPSNSTEKWTKCTTGGGTGTSATCKSSNPKTTNADASKRYGNGKTAAQIANSRGAPAGTVSGPGNSQPHKVSVCPGKTNKSGGKDVHAVKSYSTANCSSSPSGQTSTPPATQSSTPSATQSSAPPASSQVSSSSPSEVSATSNTSAVVASTPTGNEAGVLGAVVALSKPAHAKAQGGVLGTVANISGGTLPFSGFPLWEAMLAALALLAVGVALRRRSA